MAQTYFIGSPGMYLYHETQINFHPTTFDVVMSFFLGVLLIILLIFVLDKWQKEQIKEMEEEFHLLKYQLLKRGIDIKN